MKEVSRSIITLNDRFTLGFISGVLAEIVEMIFTLTLYHFHLIRFRYMDFAATMVFNHLPRGIWESVIAESAVWSFCGILGSIFAFLIKGITNKNLWFKGALFGSCNWFFIYSAVTALKIRPLFPMDTPTSVFHMFGGLIWGVSMVAAYSYLRSKHALNE